MGLPVVFLIGLLALFAASEFGGTVPGDAEPVRFAMATILLLAPTALALLARRSIRCRYVAGRRPAFEPRSLLLLSMSLSPAAVFLASSEGGYGDIAWRFAGDSYLLFVLLSAVPLVLAELPRMVFGMQVRAWLEVEAGAVHLTEPTRLPTLLDFAPMLRLRLGWVLIAGTPWLLLGAALDVFAQSRPVYAFLLGTSVGSTLGFLGLMVFSAIVLPLEFRILLGVHRRFPEPLGSTLRRTAEALDFDSRRLFLLPTGMSAVNAMMIGPLPVGRCLCITDGLLHMLDGEALTGVVAHEVGHAKMGHPGILVLLAVVMPLMLLQPLGVLPLDDLHPAWQFAIALPLVSLLWLTVRVLAHRFELEADVASVKALGAGPCSRALLAVSHATLPVRRSLLGRLSTLHPDEQTRLRTMMLYERDPVFRRRFDETGRRLRMAIFAGTLFSIVAAAMSWSLDWPYERALLHFHSGDLVAARRDADEIGEDVPGRWHDSWEVFLDELEVGLEMAPGARDWETARAAFRERAAERGIEILVRDGPAGARPWFALAADAVESGDPDRLLLHQLYEYCRAGREGDTDRMAAVRRVIVRRPVPEALRPVFE